MELKFEELSEICEKMQVSLKSVEKNVGYFTLRPLYIYDGLQLNYSQSEKCF